MEWLKANLGSLAVGTILLFWLTWTIVHLIKNGKRGVKNCGCGCEQCVMRSSCRKSTEK